jgi:hypothetical protein
MIVEPVQPSRSTGRPILAAVATALTVLGAGQPAAAAPRVPAHPPAKFPAGYDIDHVRIFAK